MHLPYRFPVLFAITTLASLVHSGHQQCRIVRSSGPQIALNNPFLQPTSPTNSSPPNSTSTSLKPFDYQNDLVRGVNLGGWFVLEPWITPSIFNNTGNENIVDEWTFGQLQNESVALAVLQQHWSTWITENDFQDIANAGLNHVRIPLGYWSVPLNISVAPFTPGAWPYFVQALEWAQKYNIHVILDLHGAPGSQNGYDNSGQRTSNYTWASDPNNVPHTLSVIQFLAANVGNMVSVFELLNEPAGYTSSEFADVVRQYWLDGYTTVRNATSSTVQVMIEDAFLGVDSWENFMSPPAYDNVLMDTHEYQIFSIPELQRTWDEHISFACTLAPPLASYSSSNLWTILGEWSTAITDCTLWLNGRGVGSRWDGTYFPASGTPVLGSCQGYTGNASTFSDEYRTFLRQYWEVQVDIGESAKGWVYWTWKAENSAEWSYQIGLQEGWIPEDPTQRLYPNICG